MEDFHGKRKTLTEREPNDGLQKKTRVEGESDFRPWADLFPEALALIFQALMLQDLFKVVPRVCKSWRDVVKGPYCWRKIDIDDWSWIWSRSRTLGARKIDKMLRVLIPRSSGSLRELSVTLLNDDMLLFIAENAGTIETLSLKYCTIVEKVTKHKYMRINESIFEQVAPKFSSVTTLYLNKCEVTPKALRAIGKNFEKLVSLTYPMDPIEFSCEWWERPPPTQEDEARAIAQTMPKLKNLNISNFDISTTVALEILAGCPELEFLDIQGCWLVNEDPLHEQYPKVKVVGPGERPEENFSWDDYQPWNYPSPGDTDSSPDHSWIVADYCGLL